MEPQQFDLTKPIVINVKKEEEKKISRGLRDFQVSGRKASKVTPA
jgi:hypothetical protein